MVGAAGAIEDGQCYVKFFGDLSPLKQAFNEDNAYADAVGNAIGQNWSVIHAGASFHSG